MCEECAVILYFADEYVEESESEVEPEEPSLEGAEVAEPSPNEPKVDTE
jgi:hypothetical protein